LAWLKDRCKAAFFKDICKYFIAQQNSKRKKKTVIANMRRVAEPEFSFM
jgi:hypothetical protein